MLLVRFFVPFLLIGCLCSANVMHAPAVTRAVVRPNAPVTVTQAASAPATGCASTFVSHNLDFATGTRLREIGTYLSNGSGVATNDLDGDGDLDLVFASIDREASILWNRGGLKFEAAPLDARFTRGVQIVDVDANGALDIVFTHRGLDGVSFWHNEGASAGGDPRFVRQPLLGVNGYAYAMAWGDLNGDGALDLVTGSYAAELRQHGIADPVQDARAGIWVYMQHKGQWAAQRLDAVAESLSIGLVDLNRDGISEIWVANDFAVRDQVWQRTGDQWQLVQPFGQTAHSAMSTEWGDIANDGRLALFSTDMNPYDISPSTMAAWLPMMSKTIEHREAGDPQLMANVLQMQDDGGQWHNEAARRGVDATGWSWSSRFGDLDQDGRLDLYVVNGMIAADMFGHLPGGELVEANQAFRNQGDGMFAPTPAWNLGSTASGRGMVMADLDGDGDLDIVVNNLRGLAQLFENQLCTGASLRVDLAWPARANHAAVGAQLALHTSAGTLRRDVRAAGGYLSGNPLQVHFGFPADAHLNTLEIVWPDGASSTVEAPAANAHLIVAR